MKRRISNRLVVVAVVSAAMLAYSAESHAGWGTYGYGYAGPYSTWSVGYAGWGGYGYAGGCGCDVGCDVGCSTGCYDPCSVGCRPGLCARIANRWRAACYARRSCCYGWRGCGLGWCGTRCGYDPCCDTCGSVMYDTGCDSCGGTSWGTGKIIEESPAVEGPVDGPVPADPGQPTPSTTPADPNLPSVMPEQEASYRLGNAMMTVQVPQGTQVLVNGVATKSKGTVRRYVSRNLVPGFHYTYEVRAVSTVDGRPSIQTKTVNLLAGQSVELKFDAIVEADLETALTLNVPKDAQVYLAGNAAPGSGMQRTFRTMKLTDGDVWKDYAVRVEVNRDGKTLTQEKTITLKAGDSRDLTFEFDVDRLAAR